VFTLRSMYPEYQGRSQGHNSAASILMRNVPQWSNGSVGSALGINPNGAGVPGMIDRSMKKSRLDSLFIKLASIAAHAEELFSVDGREADKSAIQGLLQDPEVKALLEDPKMSVYLPLKRRL